MVYAATSHNKRLARLSAMRTGRRLLAARVPQNRVRAYALNGFAPPHFASPGLCFAKSLFGLAKRRQPGTLCAIFDDNANFNKSV